MKSVQTIKYSRYSEKNRGKSFLYRTAEEVRLGIGKERCLVDGIRREVAPRLAPRKELSHKTIYEFFGVLRGHLKEYDFFVLVGRRGVVAAVLFGMMVMGSVTYLLGQGVSAKDASPSMLVMQRKVLGVETSDIQNSVSREELEQKIHEMVQGYPIEDMVPYIASQDPRVAAYLVAIAKKESNWGKRIPVYYGENCFNYWGYRGQDEIMGSAGHTCFDTPQEAVRVVAKRLDTLVVEQGLDTANKLILWKYGSTCAGHSDYSVKKWISDVDMYYKGVISAS